VWLVNMGLGQQTVEGCGMQEVAVHIALIRHHTNIPPASLVTLSNRPFAS
jgi:hypothetical protein